MARAVQIYPVILAGGSGTRFWPLSRRRRPKQLLPLASKQPLLRETLERIAGLASPGEVMIVAGRIHAGAIRKLLPRLPSANLMLEPVPRNTAPAIGWAAVRLLRRNPDAIMAVLPSDHHVRDVARFRKLLGDATTIAQTGALVTLGITPTGPETGFGYLRMGRASKRWPGGAFPVEAFKEKPDLATAERYLRSGRYLWNAGIFVFRASTVLAEIRRQLPELARSLDHIAPAVGTPGEAAAVRRWFPSAPAISIDYGVLEKASTPVVVIPADVGWSDLGSFDALSQVRRVDRNGNVIEGQAVLVDCQECIVLARERPVAVVGARRMVVVDAGDAVLVVPRDRVQEVRKAVDELQRRGLQRVL
jgi:mannose-1-phosphate guanylyltransferase